MSFMPATETCLMFDANKPGDLERAEAFGSDILRLCVDRGGCRTGTWWGSKA
jgi:hypothetical protein